MSLMDCVGCWWRGVRVPEPEAMDDPADVGAYAGAAAQRYLAGLDEGAARRAAHLAPERGWGLDVGCGPAGVPLRVAALRPALMLVGVDLSLPMLRQARAEAARQGLGSRLLLVRASAGALPFRDAAFDLVMSNSLLHHLAEPRRALADAARTAARGAAIFLRDLRRPPRPLLGAHIRFFGRHYNGGMRRLFEASVRAAYTCSELRQMLPVLPGVRVRWRGGAHVEALRPAVMSKLCEKSELR